MSACSAAYMASYLCKAGGNILFLTVLSVHLLASYSMINFHKIFGSTWVKEQLIRFLGTLIYIQEFVFIYGCLKHLSDCGRLVGVLGICLVHQSPSHITTNIIDWFSLTNNRYHPFIMILHYVNVAVCKKCVTALNNTTINSWFHLLITLKYSTYNQCYP